MLPRIHEAFAIGDHIDEIVDAANASLMQLTREAPPDTTQISAEISNLERRQKNLLERIESGSTAEESKSIVDRIRLNDRELTLLRERLLAAQRRPVPRNLKIEAKDVQEALRQLPALLTQDSPSLGAALSRLVGPVSFRQERVANRSRWYLQFTPQWPCIMALTVAPEAREYFTSTVSRLKTGPIEVVVEEIPEYEAKAEAIAALRSEGLSVNAITKRLKISASTVRDATHFHQSGVRRTYSGKRKTTSRTQKTIYKEIATKVAGMHDDELISFEQIAKSLDVAVSTVYRAYDFAHPELEEHVARTGKRPVRKHFPRLPKQTIVRIEELAREGQTTPQIQEITGASRATIRRHLQKIGLYVDGRSQPRRRK